MKKLITLILIVMQTSVGHSQGLGNIFNQKAADLKSMGKQIALFQLYMGWIEKGYSIARSGLNLIGEIKQGDFNIHNMFFSSLSNVSPNIRRCARVAAIIELVQSVTKELDKIELIKYLNNEEKKYLSVVKQNLIAECGKSLDLLVLVTNGSNLEMTDDKRLNKINQIYFDLLNKSVLSKEFIQEASMVSLQRQWDLKDVETLENLH